MGLPPMGVCSKGSTLLPGRQEPPVLVDAGRCRRCGACRAVCPHQLLEPAADGVPELRPGGEAGCLGCAQCEAVCPTGALRHRHAAALGFAPAPPPPSPEVVSAWLGSRRSVRSYRPQAVERAVLEALVALAGQAPTGHNARRVGCTAVVTDLRRAALGEDIVAFYRRLFAAVAHPAARFALRLVLGPGRVAELRGALPGMERVAARLARGEDPLFHGAPVVLVFHAPAAETADTDCALAADHVTLAAPSFGLGTCWIGYASAVLRRFPRLAARHGVPRGRRAAAVLTLGYPAWSFPQWPLRPPLPLDIR